jgi:pilus assembly protein CpaB
VAPDQAEALSLAGAQTKIQLVLRNPLDTQTVKTAGISTAQLLLGAPAPAPNPARAERPRPVKAVAPAPVVPAPAKVEPVRETIEVIRGEKREFVAIGTDGMPEVRQ